jgi:uncharacterized protein YjbJ (UPF0337 family)
MVARVAAGRYAAVALSRSIFDTPCPTTKEAKMGFWDKLMGRGKKTAGDAMGDSSMRDEGMHQEEQAMAEDRAKSAEEMAQAERERAAEHQTERDNM